MVKSCKWRMVAAPLKTSKRYVNLVQYPVLTTIMSNYVNLFIAVNWPGVAFVRKAVTRRFIRLDSSYQYGLIAAAVNVWTGIAVAKVKCPNCSKIHRVTPKVQGRKVGCKCGKIFRMPGEKINPSAVKAKPDSDSLFEVFCSTCGQGYRLAGSLAGKKGTCSCGATFQIPRAAAAGSDSPMNRQNAPGPYAPQVIKTTPANRKAPSIPESPSNRNAPHYSDPRMPGAPLSEDPLAMEYEFEVLSHDAAPETQQPAPDQYAPSNQHPPPFAPLANPDPFGGPPHNPYQHAAPQSPPSGGYWNRPASNSNAGSNGSPSRRDAYKSRKKNRGPRGGSGVSSGSLILGIVMVLLGPVVFGFLFLAGVIWPYPLILSVVGFCTIIKALLPAD